MTTARERAREAACNHVPMNDVAGCADAASDVWEAEVFKLHGLIKALCSDPSPFGSEAFRKVRDQVNPEYRELLLEILR